MRTLCLVVGHLLVFFLSPSLSIAPMTLGGCFTAALACSCLCLIAPFSAAEQTGGVPPSLTAEHFVFHSCCLLVGVLGLCGSAMHAGVYGLHALISPTLAFFWALGGAMAGPLAAAVALVLYNIINFRFPSLRTRLLLGLCTAWLLLSGILLANALRSPAARRALLLKKTQSRLGEAEEHGVTGAIPDAPAASPAMAAQQDSSQQRQPAIPSDGEEGLHETDGEKELLCEETQAFLQSARTGDAASSTFRLQSLLQQASFFGGFSVRSQWHFYLAALRQCRCSLLCCFFLSLTTFVIYPIKVQHMAPCSSSTDPALYQLLLVAAYHLGVVAGRCVWSWCCSVGFRLVPAVLVLRLTLLPLLFWFESLPRTGLMQRAAEAAAPRMQQQHLLLLLDLCRCLALFLFAALHGHLSIVGAAHATQFSENLPKREAAAYLMSLSEALGLATGTLLSIALPFTPRPLEGWKQAAAAAAPKLS